MRPKMAIIIIIMFIMFINQPLNSTAEGVPNYREHCTVLTIKQVRPPNALPLARVPCRVAAACERLLESARRGVTAVLDMDLRADEFVLTHPQEHRSGLLHHLHHLVDHYREGVSLCELPWRQRAIPCRLYGEVGRRRHVCTSESNASLRLEPEMLHANESDDAVACQHDAVT